MEGAKQWLGSAVPEAPLLVFINSRSGGRAGPRLAEVLCHAVGQSQVGGSGSSLFRSFRNFRSSSGASIRTPNLRPGTSMTSCTCHVGAAPHWCCAALVLRRMSCWCCAAGVAGHAACSSKVTGCSEEVRH